MHVARAGSLCLAQVLSTRVLVWGGAAGGTAGESHNRGEVSRTERAWGREGGTPSRGRRGLRGQERGGCEEGKALGGLAPLRGEDGCTGWRSRGDALGEEDGQGRLPVCSLSEPGKGQVRIRRTEVRGAGAGAGEGHGRADAECGGCAARRAGSLALCWPLEGAGPHPASRGPGAAQLVPSVQGPRGGAGAGAGRVAAPQQRPGGGSFHLLSGV